MDPNRKLTFELTWQSVQIICAGLHELPGRVCNPILAELQKQINEQVASDNVVSMTPTEKTDAA